MRIVKIDDPGIEAEGFCNGVPYTTDIYNAQGCAIHFWFNDENSSNAKKTLKMAMNARDVVVATWSYGKPKGFWAHQNIEP